MTGETGLLCHGFQNKATEIEGETQIWGSMQTIYCGFVLKHSRMAFALLRCHPSFSRFLHSQARCWAQAREIGDCPVGRRRRWSSSFSSPAHRLTPCFGTTVDSFLVDHNSWSSLFLLLALICHCVSKMANPGVCYFLHLHIIIIDFNCSHS